MARTSSSGSASSVVGSPHPSLGSANSNRQSSQGSLFEQFATQAKELVKETKRQSSQDGLLAQVDKVSPKSLLNPQKTKFLLCCVCNLCMKPENFIKIPIPIGYFICVCVRVCLSVPLYRYFLRICP